MTRPLLTAITVTFHTGAPLRACLEALTLDSSISEIIVVDNGNPPDMQDWLRQLASRNNKVRLITTERNIGFGAAVNHAADQAREGYLLLVNPDAIIEENSVAGLLGVEAPLRKPAIAGGHIHDASGKECRGARRRKLTLMRALTTFCGWNTWTLEKTPRPDSPVPVGAVSGAFMLVSTQSFRQLGGFDEAYFLHVEDVDLCRRAWESGGEVVYCPQAGALHYGATSDVSSRVVAGYKADSLVYYFRKFSRSVFIRALVRWPLAPLLRLALLSRARD